MSLPPTISRGHKIILCSIQKIKKNGSLLPNCTLGVVFNFPAYILMYTGLYLWLFNHRTRYFLIQLLIFSADGSAVECCAHPSHGSAPTVVKLSVEKIDGIFMSWTRDTRNSLSLCVLELDRSSYSLQQNVFMSMELQRTVDLLARGK